jgi:hypothetical protein
MLKLGNPYWRGRLSKVDILLLDKLLFVSNIVFTFHKTSCLNKEVNCTEPSPSIRLICSNCYPVISRKCISPSPAQIAPELVDQDSDDDVSSSSSSRSSNSSSESDEDEQDTRDGQDEEEEDEAESQVWPLILLNLEGGVDNFPHFTMISYFWNSK